jgi:protein-tyrosine phosphatase
MSGTPAPYASRTMTLADRRIALEACFNFRDLGGHRTVEGRRVRPGVLFRADTLHRLTPDDLDVLRGLRLRTVIDLRTRDELDRHGRVGLADDEVTHLHVPMIDEVRTPEPMADEDAPSPESRGELYLRMLERGGPAVAQAVRVLAGPGALPAVFHCTAGKDRTGVLAALVLGQLGVPDGAIAEDYALTEQAVHETRVWIETNDPDAAATYASYPRWIWEARAETMLAFLALVRAEHGSIPALLTGLGVPVVTLDALAGALLDG